MTATERDIMALLRYRYSATFHGARRYAIAEHVPDNNGDPHAPNRIADFVAVDSWPSTDFALHGHEIKVTRSDWLAELRQPDKAEAFARYMDYWWLVVADRSLVKPGELPTGWGLLAPDDRRAGQLRAVIGARRRQPEALPKGILGGLSRAIAKTAQTHPQSLTATSDTSVRAQNWREVTRGVRRPAPAHR